MADGERKTGRIKRARGGRLQPAHIAQLLRDTAQRGAQWQEQHLRRVAAAWDEAKAGSTETGDGYGREGQTWRDEDKQQLRAQSEASGFKRVASKLRAGY